MNKHAHKESVLILSYYAEMPGACQAEWLDDKVDSIKKLDYKVLLVSAASCGKNNDREVTHWRAPSVSYTDYWEEVNRIKSQGRSLPTSMYWMLPIAITFGLLIDAAQYLATKGIGEGRWSWAISATIAAIMLCVTRRPTVILSTGGPASAHLAGIVLKRLFSIPLIVELQDPLSGIDIGRNSHARGWLYKIESTIVDQADKIAYVTKGAADYATEQFATSKICSVYPGARKFTGINSTGRHPQAKAFRMVHLGSLYATRNFKTLIMALDKLISGGKVDSSHIEIINLGHVAEDIRRDIAHLPYISILPPVSRPEALQFAAEADLLLLIQNNDDRSKVTIPYKTYDYLNLAKPILALQNSAELANLVSNCGHFQVSVSDVNEIAEILDKLINNKCDMNIKFGNIEAVEQAHELLALHN